jgi:hypothetical protein
MKTTISRFILVSIALTALTAHANKAILDADGVLEIDGKKIFVICFSLPPPVDGKAPNGKNGVAELADAGATFLRAGALGGDWNDARFVEEKKFQDAAARHGMHCWLSLREAASIKPGDARHEALLRKILMTFRDHPGMGVYKGVDEPEWGKHPLPPMERAWQIIKELDPHHPVVLIQGPARDGREPQDLQRGQRHRRRGHLSHRLSAGPAFAVCEDECRDQHGRRLRAADDGGGRRKETVVDDAAGRLERVSQSGKNAAPATFPEERFMTYQAIINGARGVNYFGASIPAGWNEQDQKLGWNWHFWNRVLRPVVEEIGTKSPLYRRARRVEF